MSFLTRTFALGSTSRGLTLEDVLLAILLAFVLGQLTAWVYKYSHTGLSYSKTFVQSIILLTVIVSMAMMVIGNNIVIAFGLIGALAVIRFRNVLKDTRDTAFIFMALVMGMACGTGSYRLAIAGAILYCLLVLYLHWSFFGTQDTGDGYLRFRMDSEGASLGDVRDVLKRHCRSAQLASQHIRESGSGEVAYRLAMKSPEHSRPMAHELRALVGVSDVVFALQEDQDEI